MVGLPFYGAFELVTSFPISQYLPMVYYWRLLIHFFRGRGRRAARVFHPWFWLLRVHVRYL